MSLQDSLIELIRRTSAEIPDDVQQSILAALENETKGTIAQSALKETGSTPDECENIVNYAVELERAEIGILLRETTDGDWKTSLRASGAVDVSKIAKGFGGGGHVKAAGCTLPGPLADAEKKIVDAAAAALPGL